VRPDFEAVAESTNVALPAISMTQSAAVPLM